MSDFITLADLREKARKLRALAESPGTPGEGKAAREALARVQARMKGMEPEPEPEHERPDPFSIPEIYLTDEERAAVVAVVDRYAEIIRAELSAGRKVNLEALELRYRGEVFRAIAMVRNKAAMDSLYKNGRGF